MSKWFETHATFCNSVPNSKPLPQPLLTPGQESLNHYILHASGKININLLFANYVDKLTWMKVGLATFIILELMNLVIKVYRTAPFAIFQGGKGLQVLNLLLHQTSIKCYNSDIIMLQAFIDENMKFNGQKRKGGQSLCRFVQMRSSASSHLFILFVPALCPGLGITPWGFEVVYELW